MTSKEVERDQIRMDPGTRTSQYIFVLREWSHMHVYALRSSHGHNGHATKRR